MENEAPPALAADDAAPPAAKRRRWDTGATPAPAGAAPAAVDPTIAASAAQAAAMAAAAAAAAASATALSATAAGAAAVLPSVLGAGVLQAKEAARAALEKAQQGTMGGIAPSIAAAAQAQAAAAAAAATQGGVRPAVVTIDNQGRLLDEHGKVIQSSSRPQTTFKVNEQARKNVLLEEAPPPDVSASKYYDPRMQIPGQSRDNRKKRAFSFVAEGHFTRKAEDMRAKAAMELMLQNASQPASKRAAAAAALLAAQREESKDGEGGASGAAVALSSVTLERRLAEVPGAEWWDLPLLSATAYSGPPGDSVEANAVLDGISHLIEHPVPIAPPAEPPPPPPMPMPLTKRERKKLRTQRRLAAEKEKQDQIRCGLIDPPPPKVKISNLMSVMKDEAVADPSAIEAKVRAEMAQRVKNHEMRNQARKLTPAERRAKKKRKLTNDPTGGGTPVSLYRIDQAVSQKKQYKIDINAQQNHLTGTFLLMQECSLLVVEGGPKAQKRYRKLLMQRIDWADELMGDDEDEEDEEEDRAEARRRAALNACKLVWEGLVVKSQFRSFRVESKALDGARRLLKDKGCEHYLDMALRFGGDADEEEGEGDDDDEEEEEEDSDDAQEGEDDAAEGGEAMQEDQE